METRRGCSSLGTNSSFISKRLLTEYVSSCSPGDPSKIKSIFLFFFGGRGGERVPIHNIPQVTYIRTFAEGKLMQWMLFPMRPALSDGSLCWRLY